MNGQTIVGSDQMTFPAVRPKDERKAEDQAGTRRRRKRFG